MSTDRKIARASATLMAASAIGHVLSLAKEILVAATFGITRAMDAYFAALTIPTLLNNVLISTFGAVFIPIFVKYRLRNRDEANHIASVVINCISLLLLALAALLALLAPAVVGIVFRGLPPETALIAVKVLRVLSVTVVLSGLIGMISGVLNAQEHFAAPAFSQMCITVSTIVFILALASRSGIFVLPYGMIVGLAVQLVILIPVVARKGYQHFLSMRSDHPAVRGMVTLSLLFFATIVASHMNVVVDRIMASFLAAGSIAALGYADKLVQAPIMIFSMPIVTAAFPFFSAQAAGDRIDELRDSIAKAVRMTAFIFLPLTLVLAVLAHPFVTLLYQRGSFVPKAAALTSSVFTFYVLQLFFFTVTLLLVRVFLAFQRMSALIRLTVLGVALNAGLNLLLMRLTDPPVAGIALATSVVYAVLMSLMLLSVRRMIGGLRGGYVMDGVARMGIGAAGAAAAAAVVLRAVRAVDFASPLGGAFVRFAVPAAVAAAVFALAARLLRLEEPGKIAALLRAGPAAAGRTPGIPSLPR
ncbi:MAG: murein biosynthesis integral membrane protein MurJ [bacterium]|nr:murein biosynthesis integral membrane protein MurJ [bacterium]